MQISEVAKEEKMMSNENKTEYGGMFGLGEPNTGFAQYFIGD